MDDAMYDMQTGSQDDGAGHEPVKRKPVRPATFSSTTKRC